jgi:hypothetical protein
LQAEAAKRKREAEGQEEEERAARKAVKEGERKAAKVSFHDDDDDDDEPTSVTGAAKSTPSTSAPVSIQKNDEVATGVCTFLESDSVFPPCFVPLIGLQPSCEQRIVPAEA